MTIYYCIEDAISRSVAEKLISVCCSADIETHELGKAYGGFGYIKNNMAKFANLAQNSYVFVIADLDRATCAPSLRENWLNYSNLADPLPKNMVFCIAKTEIESWLLADTFGIASFLQISPAKMRANIEDTVIDAKEYLVTLARSSKNRMIRNDMVPQKNSVAATGISYNFRLTEFAKDQWDPVNAAQNSVSLKRAMDKLSALTKPKMA